MAKTKGRRGHGEGSIYQRESDGRWCATVDLGYVNSKRKRKIIYGTSRREVAEKLKTLLHQQQQGLPVATERQTVEQFLNTWLQDVVALRVRPQTALNYRMMVKNHLIPGLGRIQLQKLTPQDVQRFLLEKQKTGLAISTLHQMRQTLRSALNQAIKWQLISRNAASLAELPTLRYRPAQALNQSEVQTFLDVIKGDTWEVAFLIALTLGLRRGEVLGLQWSDIDFEQRTLTVRHTLQFRIGQGYVLGPPKTATSARVLPLPSNLHQALQVHAEQHQQKQMLAGDTWHPEWNLVFCTKYGTPEDGHRMLARLQKLLAQAGLPFMRFHDLRHSCASLLAAQGVSARVAMEILGHSDVSITLNLYTHVLDTAKRDATDKLDDLLKPKK